MRDASLGRAARALRAASGGYVALFAREGSRLRLVARAGEVPRRIAAATARSELPAVRTRRLVAGRRTVGYAVLGGRARSGEAARLLRDAAALLPPPPADAIEAVTAISARLAGRLDRREALAAIVDTIHRLVRAPCAFVALWDRATDRVGFPYYLEDGKRRDHVPDRAFSDGLTEHVLRTGKVFHVRREFERACRRRGIAYRGTPSRSWLGAPLLVEGEAVGVLAVYDNEREEAFSREDERLLVALAAQAAATLRNAELFRAVVESEERYRLAMRATKDVFYDWDIARDRLVWSASATEALGWSVEEMGTTVDAWADRIHPADRPAVDAALDLAVRTSSPFTGEYRFRRKDGSWALLYDRGLVVAGPDGRAVRMVGTMVDVTEQRAANERVVEIYERMTDAFYAVDREWRFVYMNPVARSMQRNVSWDEIRGRVLWEVFPDLRATRWWDELHRAVREGRPVRFEEAYPRLGMWFETAAYPSAEGLSVYFRDITARKKAEQALRDANETLGAIVEGSPLAIVAVDRGGLLSSWNAAAQRLFGWSAEEVLGRPPPLLPDGEAAENLVAERAVREGTAIESREVRRRRKDGAFLDVIASAAPLRGADGEVRGAVAVYADVTERRAAEERLVGLMSLHREITENVPAGILYLDPDGRVTYLNGFLLRLMGLRPEDLQRSLFRNVLGTSAVRDDPALETRLRELLRGVAFRDHEFAFEVPQRRKDDPPPRRLVTLVSGVPVADARGGLRGAVLFVRDATEERQLARRLTEYARELEAHVAERTQALARANADLATVFENTTDGILFVDRTLELVSANARFAEFFGLELGDVLRGDKETVRAKARAMYRDPRQFDLALRGYDGDLRDKVLSTEVELVNGRVLHETSVPILRGGEWAGRVWTYHDITSLKKLERDLSDRSEFLNAVLDNVAEAVFTFDEAGRFIYANRRAETITGYPLEELQDVPFLDLLYPGERAPKGIFRRLLSGESVTDFEIGLRSKTGRRVPLLVSIVPIREGDRLVHYVGTAFDLSEKRRLERVLAERTRLLDTVLDHTADGVFALDADGRLTFANGRFHALLGVPESERGAPLLDWLESRGSPVTSRVAAALRGEETIACEAGDGTAARHIWTLSPVREGDAVREVIGTVTDISERHRLEEELRRYAQTLEEEVERRTTKLVQSAKMAALGQLVAGVAHEINNPLAFVKSNTATLREEVGEILKEIEGLSPDAAIAHLAASPRWPFLRDDVPRLLDMNLKGLGRIRDIVDRLRTFAAPQAPRKEAVDLETVVRDTGAIFLSQFRDRVDLEQAVRPVPPVVCDAGQIGQVVMNLLVNAAQAIDGKGTVRLALGREGRWAVLAVEDTGVGIPAGIIKKIFDPFFTTKEKGSTGLGLSISYSIVKEHRGDITVESEPGKGTVVRVLLPLEEPT